MMAASMESLNKQQLILLALLVSFVTSIATGIVTVSLMDQAPAGVTQTINRVVEKTIERVVQAPAQPAAVVTKEVIVTEQDLITAAIEKNTNSNVIGLSKSADIKKKRGQQTGNPGHGRRIPRDIPVLEDFCELSDKERCCCI